MTLKRPAKSIQGPVSVARLAPTVIRATTNAMTMTQIDQPEPRWQVVLALLAVTGIHLALPKELVVGPAWLLPLLVVVLLVPTVFAHRTGRHSLNHILGIVIGAIITFGLVASVVLLVTTLPEKKEPPLALLGSGGALWLTNVLVFALWYWRLDGGGPMVREAQHEFGSHSFVFPQMQIEKLERKRFGVDGWRPGFVDYLFVAFTTSSTFGPTDAPLLTHWVKLLTMIQICISLTIMVLLISRAVGVL
jgi:hypothetical protein